MADDDAPWGPQIPLPDRGAWGGGLTGTVQGIVGRAEAVAPLVDDDRFDLVVARQPLRELR